MRVGFIKSGCGSVGRAVASKTRGSRFESSHRHIVLEWRNMKKRPRIIAFLQNLLLWEQFISCQLTLQLKFQMNPPTTLNLCAWVEWRTLMKLYNRTEEVNQFCPEEKGSSHFNLTYRKCHTKVFFTSRTY